MLRFGDIAGQDGRAPRKAGIIDGQGKGHQRTIRALLFGVPEAGQLRGRASGHVGIGEIVEDNRSRRVEEGAFAGMKGILQRRPVTVQEIAGAIELVERDLLPGIEIQQLQYGTVGVHPAVGLAFTGGMDDAGHHQGGGDPGITGGDAEPVKDFGKPEFGEGMERQPLATDRAVLFAGEAVKADGCGPVFVLGVSPVEALDDLCGLGLEGRVGIEQGPASGHQGLDQIDQQGPLRFGDGKLCAEIEEGFLLDLSVDHAAFDEAHGAIGFSGPAPCCCFANIHVALRGMIRCWV